MTTRSRTLSVMLVAWLAAGATAVAQEREPIGWFVADLRGALARYGHNLDVAIARDLVPDQLPGNGLGLDVGAHVYPLRWRAITFGVGLELLFSRGSRGASETDPDPEGPTVRTRFDAVSPQLSFNFGSKRGWSYLSGGLGTSTFTVTTEEATTESRRSSTINYGGGARWFASPHVAFAVDLRFYAINPLESLPDGQPGQPRQTLLVLSIGVAFQ